MLMLGGGDGMSEVYMLKRVGKRELGPLSSGQGKSMQFVDPDRIEQSDHVQAASFAPSGVILINIPNNKPYFLVAEDIRDGCVVTSAAFAAWRNVVVVLS